MITGFNTDVRHGGVIFHVQTEDKGTGNPCIESLVYVGGQILARKRSGYQSLLEEEDSIAAVTELMETQHRTLIAAIRAGRMDQKAEELTGKAPKPAAPAEEQAKPTEPAPSTRVEPPEETQPPSPATRPAAKPAKKSVDRQTIAAVPLKKLLAGAPPAPARPEPRAPKPAAKTPAPPEAAVPPPSQAKAEAPAEKAEGPAEKAEGPAEKAEGPAEKAEGPAESAETPDDRSLDQVILDYLEMESEQEKLVLSMDHRSGDLAPGTATTVSFRTRSSLAAEPISDAKITVRLISTIGEPQLLGEGKTDDRGQLELTIDVPLLKTGSGALIVSAESPVGKAEMRHLI